MVCRLPLPLNHLIPPTEKLLLILFSRWAEMLCHSVSASTGWCRTQNNILS